MKVHREFVTNENDAQINWDYNAATSYSVVNKDEKNRYGEYKGYTIAPGESRQDGCSDPSAHSKQPVVASST
jgi:Cu2+-containing amine oxidase